MTLSLLGGLAVLAVLVPACATTPQQPEVKHYLSGKEFPLEEFQGHVTLLNFWATWCKPCLKEIPELARVASESNGNVVFVAVYYEPESVAEPQVAAWLRVQPDYFAHQVAWGNKALLKLFPHRLLPTTYVLGRSGTVVETFEGSITTEAQLAELRAAIDVGLQQAPPLPRQTP